MGQRTENREVVVQFCDFCGWEAKTLDKCAICKREMCNKYGGMSHAAFKVDLYRYSDAARFIGHVCHDCAKKEIPVAVQELLNEMIGSAPARAKEQPSQRQQLASDVSDSAMGPPGSMEDETALRDKLVGASLRVKPLAKRETEAG